MIIVLLILMILFIFIILLFVDYMRVKLVFDSGKTDMNLTFLWLSPLTKAFVNIENSVPVLKVYLFSKIVYTRALKGKKNKYGGMELVKLSEPEDIHVNVHYGFEDPFTTGITCGAISIASQFLNIASVNQNPDFLAAEDYIYLDATAKVNLGAAILRLIKSR